MSLSLENAERRAGETTRRFFWPGARIQRPGLTGLRALAALLVVAFHMFAYAKAERLLLGVDTLAIDVTPLVTIGWVGVDLFFVLSGFLITIHLVERLGAGGVRRAYPGYLRDRILRVVPAYWAQIAILFVIALATTHAVPAWTSLVPAHLLFLQNFSLPAHSGINGIYWSLPVEFSFYLVAPFVVAAVVRDADGRVLRRRAAIIAVAGIAIAIAWRMGAFALKGAGGIGTLFWASSAHLPGNVDQFGLGMGAALLFLAAGAPSAADEPRWARGSDALVAAGLAGLAGAMYALDRWVALYWTDSMVFYTWHSAAAAALAVLVAGVAMRGRLARILFENRLVLWLGVISYSMYLWHLILLPKVAAAVDASQGSLARFALVALPVVLAVSAASYYAVERPFLRLKAGARGERPTIQ